MFLRTGVYKQRRQIAAANKFCMVGSNTVGPSARNLLHVTFLVTRIMERLLDFSKNCASFYFFINTTCQSTHFILYTIKIVFCQGDMFRPLLGHLQALCENISKRNFNALRDPKCLQIVLQECKIHKFVYIEICMTLLVLKV